MNCPCTGTCRLSLALRKDGPFPECAPVEHYFFVVRDRWVPDGEGGADWDGDFISGRHATIKDALAVVRAGTPMARYVIQEVPRMGMFPAWAGYGGPDAQVRETSSVELMETAPA